MAVLYGASPSWPLAHLPNAAAHGPASTALGDSWKAHHHDINGRTRRPAKLLLAGGRPACSETYARMEHVHSFTL